jgi:RNA recognition motif-containing protein
MVDDELETTKNLEKKQIKEEEPKDGDAGEDADADNDESGKRKRKRKRKKKTNAAAIDENATTGDKAADPSIDKLNSNDHTVYLEGIPFVCTEDEVKQFFVSNGCEDVLQLRLPT